MTGLTRYAQWYDGDTNVMVVTNYFLIWSKIHPYLVWVKGQEYVIMQVMHTKGELTTTILLNGYSTKLITNDLLLYS